MYYHAILIVDHVLQSLQNALSTGDEATDSQLPETFLLDNRAENLYYDKQWCLSLRVN